MDPMFQGQLKEWFLILASWGFFGACIYVIAATLRRRQQNAMQKHMLEKFSSAQDFAAFVQSPAGQKYVMSFSESVTNPRNAILRSLRTGIILMFLGGGLTASTGAVGAYTKSWIDAIGVVLIFLGLGFVLAAAVSYFLAKRIGVSEKEL
ncbi:MAG TPA: hypothetical protein VI488_19145 [Candidatus Angelobacter sp.]